VTVAIPKRVEYSLRALAALAEASPSSVNARVLADTHAIPPGYVYDVLADLRRADLVSASRGSHGGYALTRPPAQITVGAVVRLLDGSGPPADPSDDPVGARLSALWDAANHAGLSFLDTVTLADISTGQ
jgi:Rrf2 family protein